MRNNIELIFNEKFHTDRRYSWRHRIASKLIDGREILDIGGGNGLLFDLIRTEHKFLLDISSVGLKQAQAKGVICFKGDIHLLPFKNDQFDTAVLLDVLEHTLKPESVIREATRVAKRLLIVVPNFNSFKQRISVFFGKVPFQNKPNRGGHCYWFNYSVLKTMLVSNGVTIIKEHFEPPGKVPKFISQVLVKIFPNLFSHSFAVLVEKNQAKISTTDSSQV